MKPVENTQVLTFDNAEWSKSGDIGDNSCFWKKATIINERIVNGESLIDVQFEDGKISNGHFKHAIKQLSQ